MPFAFCSCHSLKSLDIPSNATSIGDSAFDFCENLIQITIPSSVKCIGMHIFNNCKRLKDIIVHPNNQFYSSLNGVLYTKNMKNLICYPNNKQQTSFRIPDTVETIEYDAFMISPFLTSITIGENVRYLHASTFSMSFNITSITVLSKYLSLNSFNNILNRIKTISFQKKQKLPQIRLSNPNIEITVL